MAQRDATSAPRNAVERMRLDALGGLLAARSAVDGLILFSDLAADLTSVREGRRPLWTKARLEADVSTLVASGKAALGVVGASLFVSAWPIATRDDNPTRERAVPGFARDPASAGSPAEAVVGDTFLSPETETAPEATRPAPLPSDSEDGRESNTESP